MLAAATLWVLASPFLIGAAVGSCGRANRFVARHYRPALLVGWTGVGLLLSAVLVFDGTAAWMAGFAGAPLAGLSFWSRPDDGEDDDDDGSRGDPQPEGDFDWDEFAREFEEYLAARGRRTTRV